MYLTNLVFSAIIDYFQLIDSKEMSPNELAIEEIVPPLSALLFVWESLVGRPDYSYT